MRTFQVSRSIYSLAFAPDGGLWVGDGTGRVHLYDPATGTGQPVFQVQPGRHTSAVYNLSVSADGQLVAAASYDRVSVIVPGPPTQDVRLPPKDEFPSALRATLAPNGALLAVTDPSGNAVLWNRLDRQVRPIGPREGFATAVAFSPDSRLLAVGYMDRQLAFCDPDTGAEDGPRLDVTRPEAVSFSPDGQILAVAYGSTILLWDVATRQRLRAIRTGQAIVRRLAFHPGGRMLAAAGDTPTLTLWDIDGGSCGKFNWGISKVQALAFAPDGMTAAAGGSGGSVAIWDVE